MQQSLSITNIFLANSLNYGEGTSNISELKKFHRGNGIVHTFASRQSLRYDIVRMGNEMFGWNLDTVDKKSGVIQFRKDVTIEDSVEMDLFGYLKTDKVSKKRSAVARLSHAISLEPYKGDMEFLNNMGLAERISDNPNLASLEQHQSFYAYTITVDLNRVGVDEEIELPAETKATRVKQLLEILKWLYRDIKGRRENLTPLFAIGGVFPGSNPFFMGRVELMRKDEGWALRPDLIQEVLDMTWNGNDIRQYTRAGIVSGTFKNEEELISLLPNVRSIEEFFEHLKQDVNHVYEG